MNLKRSLFLGLTLLLCATVPPLLWSQGGAKGAKVTQFTPENGNVDSFTPENGMVTVRIAQTRYKLRFDPNNPENGAVLKALKVGQKVQVTLDKAAKSVTLRIEGFGPENGIRGVLVGATPVRRLPLRQVPQR